MHGAVKMFTLKRPETFHSRAIPNSIARRGAPPYTRCWGRRADVSSACTHPNQDVATDPLKVTRLRTLAVEARDSAKRASAPDIRRQYEDIARHYEQLIETLVEAAVKSAHRAT